MKKTFSLALLVFLALSISLPPLGLIPPVNAESDSSSLNCTVNYTGPQEVSPGVNVSNWFTNTKIPYEVASMNRFSGTLATYELPKGSSERYVSVVWNGNSTRAYLFNSQIDPPLLFSSSHVVGHYLQTIKQGNWTKMEPSE
jgi:streptogramin lyase